MTAPAAMPGDVATTLATEIMALDWMDRLKWAVETQADRHGEIQEMIDAALAPILAEKERLQQCVAETAPLRGQDRWSLDMRISSQRARIVVLEAALAAERERCAKVAEDYVALGRPEDAPAAIRAGE